MRCPHCLIAIHESFAHISGVNVAQVLGPDGVTITARVVSGVLSGLFRNVKES